MIRLLVPKIGRRRSGGPISRLHFVAPSIFHEECLRKICRKVIFTLFTHDPIFGANKDPILKIESCEQTVMSVHMIQFWSQLLLRFKEASDTNQHFHELKQYHGALHFNTSVIFVVS